MNHDANYLLDFVIGRAGLKNDAALSRALGVQPPVISKIRHYKLKVGPEMILKIHDATDIPVREIKGIIGLKCLPLKTQRGGL